MKVKFLIGALAAAMLLSACGNKGDDAATETTPPVETAPPVEATPPADQTTPPPADQTTPPPEQTPPAEQPKSEG